MSASTDFPNRKDLCSLRSRFFSSAPAISGPLQREPQVKLRADAAGDKLGARIIRDEDYRDAHAVRVEGLAPEG